MISLRCDDVLTPYRRLGATSIVCDGEGIVSVGRDEPDSADVYDLTGLVVSPGFIDIHVHGGGGHELWSANPDEIVAAARFHAQHGTTSLVPSVNQKVQLALDEDIRARFDALLQARDQVRGVGAHILGLHVEGPTVAGAGCPAISADPELYLGWIEYSGMVLRWTIAPELPGALETVRLLVDRGVHPSIGHSEGDVASAIEAFEMGARHFTHIYTGMTTVHRVRGARHAGLLEAAFLLDEAYAEMICDGGHLLPELMRLVYQVKGADHVCIVSDGSSAMGLPDGPIHYLGTTCYVEGDFLYNESHTGYMGACCPYDRMLGKVVAAGVPLQDAVRMATSTPARSLGLTHKGVLARGHDADVVAFDPSTCEARFVMAGGRVLRNDLG